MMKKRLAVIFMLMIMIIPFAHISAASEEVPAAKVKSINVVDWYGNMTFIDFDYGFNQDAGNLKDLETNGTIHDVFSKISYIRADGSAAAFSGLSVSGTNYICSFTIGTDYKAGDTIEIREGFKLWDKDGDNYFIAAEFKDTVRYTFRPYEGNGEDLRWQSYIGFTSMTVTPQREIPLDATFKIVPEVQPATALQYRDYTFVSDNEAVATVANDGTVKGITAGVANITVTLGSLTQSVEVTVLEDSAAAVGIEILTGSTIETYIGYDYNLQLLTARYMLEGGVTGNNIDILESMVSGTVDLESAGTYTLTLTVDGFTATFDVVVKEIAAMQVESISWDGDWNSVKIFVNSTSTDNHLSGEIKQKASEKIELISDTGVEYSDTLVLSKGFYARYKDNAQPAKYDRLVLKKGLTMFKGGNPEVELKEEKTYIFNGSSWVVYNTPTGISLVSDDISLAEKTTAQIGAIPQGTSFAKITYSSDKPAVATVSASGLINAVKVGTAEITVTLGSFTKKVMVTVTEPVEVEELVIVSSSNFEIELGNEFDITQFKAKLKFTDGSYGAEVDLTVGNTVVLPAINVNAAGAQAVTFTVTIDGEEYSSGVTLLIKAFEELIISNLKNDSAWKSPMLTFSNVSNIVNFEGADYSIYNKDVLDHVEYVSKYNKVTGAIILGQNVVFFLEKSSHYNTGDILHFKKGFKMYGVEDGNVVVEGILSSDIKYVYSGSNWVLYNAPTDFTLEQDYATIREKNIFSIKASALPGTYGQFTYTSSDEDVATVDAYGIITAKTEGTATITVKLVGTEVTKAFSLTVTEALAVKKIILLPNISYYVLKGVDFVFPYDLSAKFVFEDDSQGQSFEISADDVSIEGLDVNTAGKQVLVIRVKVGEELYDGVVEINVYEYVDQRVTSIGTDAAFGNNLMISFDSTITNLANITETTSLDGVLDNITYESAAGLEVEATNYWMLSTNLMTFLRVDGNPFTAYAEGDILTLKEGLNLWKWAGALDAGGPAKEQGVYLVEGKLPSTLVFRFNGVMWTPFVPYEGFTVDESIDIAINGNIELKPVKIPAGATEGQFSYSSSDESVATVSSRGVLRGIKAGTVTIIVTLTDGENPIVKTISVTVSDAVKSIIFSPESITSQLGNELSLSNVVAKHLYESGKVGDPLDLSDAVISGFDKDKLGEQTVVITVGEYSGTLTVVVQAKKGCSSMGTGGMAAIVAMLALSLAAVIVYRKKQNLKV